MLLTTLFSILVSTAQANPTATVPCPTGEIQRHGKVKHDEINEASGLIVTDSWLWIHNDSGDGPNLYAVDKEGQKRASILVHEAYARDWEEMTSFTDGDKKYFLIGDTGDNKERQDQVSFYVIEQPSSNTTSPLLYRFTADYGELGAKDVEAFVVDPITKKLLLITKGRDGIIHFLESEFPLPSKYSSSIEPVVNDVHLGAPHITFSEIAQQQLGTLPLDKREQSRMITSATIHPSGEWLIIRNYLSAKAFHKEPEQLWSEALANPPCRIPLPLQPQGETLSFAPNGKSLWTISEGEKQSLYQIHLNFQPE